MTSPSPSPAERRLERTHRTPPPAGALALADHEVAARLARGWVLQHRPVRTARDVASLADELHAWHRSTSDALIRRAGGHAVAKRFDEETGPLVGPDEGAQVPVQAALVRSQLELRLRWLEALRDELGDHVHDEEPPPPRAHGPLVVLRGDDSSTADAAASALEALGEGFVREVVTDDLAALERAGDAYAAIVVVDRLPRTDRPTTGAALALGWAVGALGGDRVLAVLARGVDPATLAGACAAVPVEGHRRWRTEVVAWAAAATRPG